ncbi:MAG TPA: phosphatase domain-containing protein, partial [Sandaracinaceae bacterium]
MVSLASALQRVLFEADRRWGRGYRRLRDVLGVSRPPRIVPYRGWSFGERATILARVLEDRGAPEWREGGSLLHTFEASYKRYATLEIPEALVEVRWNGACWHERTDEEGHLSLVVTPPARLSPGWTEVELALADLRARASAEVLVTPPDAELAIVSDIDDTVIDTNVRHPIARAATFFLTDSRVRLPFEGVAAFYRALHRGKNPIFYVSSSPWNLYE